MHSYNAVIIFKYLYPHHVTFFFFSFFFLFKYEKMGKGENYKERSFPLLNLIEEMKGKKV